jgi:hypothetical protein
MRIEASLLAILSASLLVAAGPNARANLGDTMQQSVQRYGIPTVVSYDGPNSYGFRDDGWDIYEYFDSEDVCTRIEYCHSPSSTGAAVEFTELELSNLLAFNLPSGHQVSEVSLPMGRGWASPDGQFLAVFLLQSHPYKGGSLTSPTLRIAIAE